MLMDRFFLQQVRKDAMVLSLSEMHRSVNKLADSTRKMVTAEASPGGESAAAHTAQVEEAARLRHELLIAFDALQSAECDAHAAAAAVKRDKANPEILGSHLVNELWYPQPGQYERRRPASNGGGNVAISLDFEATERGNSVPEEHLRHAGIRYAAV